ncbi:hypothetical protein EV421DRAFT_1809158 [Armillaria borealis]|uniref:Uncharacterized protein n=1 Tax=Armillaria borealis TaxID=47425 RepID=A0AA39ME42_9AGAR|nr:hypothetical protein EV421DRAFT_1860086 [Armillaria borealis]KAK0442462.1 hypothetical protein EV421DRAFT_1809158 [Armillaria borealis]
MMVEYATLVQLAGDDDFVAKEREIGCKSHVVNLSSQKMIKTYSKSSHFDPKDPEAHHPQDRDEVGLIRAITVKVYHTTMEGTKRLTVFLGKLLFWAPSEVHRYPSCSQ